MIGTFLQCLARFLQCLQCLVPLQWLFHDRCCRVARTGNFGISVPLHLFARLNVWNIVLRLRAALSDRPERHQTRDFSFSTLELWL